MGTHMHLSYFMTLLVLPMLVMANPKIEVVPTPKTMEDFQHQFKGCLENSECDQIMGMQMGRWKEFIKNLQLSSLTQEKKALLLEDHRQKHGIAVEFYTYQKSQQGLKPILFNSPCRGHHPEKGDKILKGISFIKSLSNKKVILSRDQDQIELAPSELIMAQPVIVYHDQVPSTFLLPLGDQPLFIKSGLLYVVREEEDYFYILTVSLQGEWKIAEIDQSQLSVWEEKRTEVDCPKDNQPKAPSVFGVEFCKSVWNEDTKKTVVIKMHLGC
jgi:hypothetical protein